MEQKSKYFGVSYQSGQHSVLEQVSQETMMQSSSLSEIVRQIYSSNIGKVYLNGDSVIRDSGENIGPLVYNNSGGSFRLKHSD